MIGDQFTCPKCGGHEYGSSFPEGPQRPCVRNCHGTTVDGQSCRFLWPEADDPQYFRTAAQRIDAVTDGIERGAASIRDTGRALKRMGEAAFKIAEPALTKIAHGTTVNGRPVRGR